MNALPSHDQIAYLRTHSIYDQHDVLRQNRDAAFSNYLLNGARSETFSPVAWTDCLTRSIFQSKTTNTGIIIADVIDFCKHYPDKAHILFSQTTQATHPLDLLINSSYLRGYVIYMPRGIYHLDGEFFDQLYQCASIEKWWFIIDEGAQVIIDNVHSVAPNSYHLQSISFFLGASASLTYDFTHAVSFFQATFWHIYLQDAAILNASGWLHCNDYSRFGVCLYVQGTRVEAQWRCGYQLDNKNQLMLETRQYHMNSNSNSSMDVRGIINNQGQSSYQSLIDINELAQNSIAQQQHKNILLSDTAYAWAKPSLQVLTDQVHCSHGTAIGTFDAESVLYLMSRGFAQEQAQEILIKGFFEEIGLQLSQ